MVCLFVYFGEVGKPEIASLISHVQTVLSVCRDVPHPQLIRELSAQP